MNTRSVVLTYREYEALPADGRRYEIHEGELSVTPAPSPQHQMISRNLLAVLHSHVKAKGIGEVLYAPLDVILSDTSIVQPDIVYLDPSRVSAISRRGVEGPPTLVVEILSPTTTLTDRSTKHQLYARYAVPFFWLVDPEGRSVESFVLGPQGYSLAMRASGTESVSPPPFPDLALIPESLWP
ncbi:MAG TPA: Uma2 family endonuclease [Candidatus Methylomirabilis sp.]|nr:Uma2 family endonuclease [Candidatus Methylomirabilis sp.]